MKKPAWLLMTSTLLSLSTVGVCAEAPLPELSQERVIFHTNVGDIAVAFFPKTAPKHTKKILELVKAGVYNGIPIGRIEKGFVAQVYNYDARLVPVSDQQRAHVSKIPAEFSSVLHRRGILSMAREDDDINSGEVSFSFLLGEAPHLDHQYTVFGQVVAGMEVLSAIEGIPTDGTTPIVPVTIERAEVIDAAQFSTTQLQGVNVQSLPYEKGKVLFEILAGVMFLFTVSTPIYKSVFTKPATR